MSLRSFSSSNSTSYYSCADSVELPAPACQRQSRSSRAPSCECSCGYKGVSSGTQEADEGDYHSCLEYRASTDEDSSTSGRCYPLLSRSNLINMALASSDVEDAIEATGQDQIDYVQNKTGAKDTDPNKAILREFPSEKGSEERKQKLILVALVFGMVALHTLADNFLYLADVPMHLKHRWFPLFLRACAQILMSCGVSAYYRKLPCGKKRSLALNVVVGVSTFTLLFLLNYSYRHGSINSLLMTSYTLVIMATYVFVMATALEPFLGHRVVLLLVLFVAVLLLTQPQIFAYYPVQLEPIFTLDITFGFPLAVTKGYNNHTDSNTNGFGAFFTMLLAPIFAAYILVLSYIQPRERGSHTTTSFWMGIAAFLFVVFEYLYSHGVDSYGLEFPSSVSFIVYSSLCAVCGTVGTELFLYVLSKKSPNLVIIFRYMELGIIFILQACYGLKGFRFHDLFALALILVSTAHAVFEIFCYGNRSNREEV